MNIIFSENKPATVLQPFIQCYWSGKFNTEQRSHFSQSVVPNGCIELIIHLTQDHCFLSNNGEDYHVSPAFTILRLHTKPFEVRFKKEVHVFAIRFYPDGIKNIFGISPAEFMANYDNSTDVFGVVHAGFCSRIRDAKNVIERQSLADEYILQLLANNHQNADYTHHIMHSIRASKGMADYEKITHQAPVTSRQLQREFRKHYGITIRDYVRIERMNAVQNYLMKNNKSLTHLTYDLEFADQSHFIREFRNYTGVAPRSFLKNREKFIVNIPQYAGS